jgi:hypothetical protein
MEFTRDLSMYHVSPELHAQPKTFEYFTSFYPAKMSGSCLKYDLPRKVSLV